MSNTKTIEVVINSPALEYLRSILPKEWCLSLREAEFLAKVVIGCFSQQPPSYANAHDMLRGMKNVQTLQLPDAFIQDLCDCDHNLPLPLYDKLTYLKICYWGCLLNVRCLEYLLAQCIALETLSFEQQEERSITRTAQTAQTTSTPYLLQESRLAGLLCHIKRIEVKVSKIENAEAIMKIIEFFLNNAAVLEELNIGVRQAPHSQVFDIMRELLILPRVSKKCRVVFNRLN